MSIYIKDMEMPNICAKCPFFTEWRDHGICDLTRIEMFFIEKIISMRHEKCPLIEVPEPHGRLIDADALADDLEADGKEFGDEMKLNCASWLRSNATPTIIESEVEE